jgi:hypothetical protein
MDPDTFSGHCLLSFRVRNGILDIFKSQLTGYGTIDFVLLPLNPDMLWWQDWFESNPIAGVGAIHHRVTSEFLLLPVYANAMEAAVVILARYISAITSKLGPSKKIVITGRGYAVGKTYFARKLIQDRTGLLCDPVGTDVMRVVFLQQTRLPCDTIGFVLSVIAREGYQALLGNIPHSMIVEAMMSGSLFAETEKWVNAGYSVEIFDLTSSFKLSLIRGLQRVLLGGSNTFLSLSQMWRGYVKHGNQMKGAVKKFIDNPSVTRGVSYTLVDTTSLSPCPIASLENSGGLVLSDGYRDATLLADCDTLLEENSSLFRETADLILSAEESNIFAGKTFQEAYAAAEVLHAEEGTGDKLVLLAINDFHSAFSDSVNRLASLFQFWQDLAAPRLVFKFNIGNLLLGTSYFDLFQGTAEATMLREMGFHASAVGNHDMDAVASFPLLAAQFGHSVLCANVTPKEPAFQSSFLPYCLFQVGAHHKIAVTAVLAADAWDSTNPKARENYIYQDPITALDLIVKKMRSECDIIICLSHSGRVFDLNTLAPSGLVDIIFGGHSHLDFLRSPIFVKNDLDNGIGGTILLQGRAKCEGVARSHIELLRGKIVCYSGALDELSISECIYPQLNLPWLTQYTEDHDRKMSDIIAD